MLKSVMRARRFEFKSAAVRSLVSATLILTMVHAGPNPLHAADDAALLAPQGELRIALVISNPSLVTREPDGQLRGVAIDLGNALAAQLGVPARVVPYENPTRYSLSLGKDEWDIALTPRDLSRTSQLAFSDVFMEADNGYVARSGASLTSAQDVDRAGVRVAVAQGSAVDGFLSRSLKNAQIVRIASGVAAAREALAFGRADVFADATSQAYRIAGELPGASVLIGRFNVVAFSIAVPKSKSTALPALNRFVSEAKHGGLLTDMIKRTKLRGLRPAR